MPKGCSFHFWLDFTVRKFSVRVNHTAGLTNIHLTNILVAGSSWSYHIPIPLVEALLTLKTSDISFRKFP